MNRSANSTRDGDKSRHHYTRREDKLIIQYLLDTEDVVYLGGNEVWKRLERRRKYNPYGCSFHSLKERWRKVISRSLPRYGLSDKQIDLLLQASKRNLDKERRKKAGVSYLDMISDDDNDNNGGDDDNDDDDDDETRSEPTNPKPRTAPLQNTPRRNSSESPHSPLKSCLRSPKESTRIQETTPSSDRDRNRSDAAASPQRAAVQRRALYRDTSPQLVLNSSICSDHYSPERVVRLNAGLVAKYRSRNNSSSDRANSTARRVRFENDSSDADDAYHACRSPVIETGNGARSRLSPLNGQGSSDNLMDGVMYGALLPSQQTDPAVSTRTRSARRAFEPSESSEMVHSSSESLSLGGTDLRSPRRRPIANILVNNPFGRKNRSNLATLPKHADVDADVDDAVGVADGEVEKSTLESLLRPSTSQRPPRISSQEMLRNVVEDTPVDSEDNVHGSEHSALVQRRAHDRAANRGAASSSSQDSVDFKSHMSTRKPKRKNGDRTSSKERQENAVKKSRQDTTSTVGERAETRSVASSELEQGLVFSMHLTLKFPEVTKDSNNAVLVTFLDLIKTTLSTHQTWRPHGQCLGLHEFLFMCKLLGERISRPADSKLHSEWAFSLVDRHLYNIFEMPLCTKVNQTVNCKGAHRHLVNNAQWSSILRSLTSIYEARELVKHLE